MAGRSSSLSMVSAHRLFAPARSLQHAADPPPALELDEADIIWGGGGASASSSPVDTYGRTLSSMSSTPSKASKPRAAAPRDVAGGPASLPVDIPDWSKILGPEYTGGGSSAGRWPSDERGGDAYLDRGEGGGGRQWVPPHEQLMCRERAAASFSVREGAGRTLKGRDLRRVRNAIWEKTGFQD
ncbi:uncharacterized protein LOC100830832 [Brachypodium distachyon]|uniref:Senescence regulator n=1 Tax=Brachypodium distachyon TaxID=15368 RepID=I1I4S3_BRADI|nr:uncharacterized protein LOC100830832 [Brachypodium distachyon]KQJ97135.1 hypothetical protein BRADI_3g28990v3 [Brachypodium distachyon]|eukprot:XP_003571889.1 uncharacterized protein LOC100830832 [Brachypodium distachyon]